MPNADASTAKTYTLKTPVTWGNEKYTKIVLARPKGKHIKHLGKDLNLGQIMKVALKISDVPPPVFDELDSVDYLKIGEIIGDFLDTGQEGGAND